MPAHGRLPALGEAPPRTKRAIARAQSRALLHGPFAGGLVRGISDGALMLEDPATVRQRGLALAAAAGADIVRIPVDWEDIAAASVAASDATNPANPGYHFSLVDAAVRDTVRAGLTPLLVVSHAPKFAEAAGRWRYAYAGSWAPRPAALAAFATALARRYDGAFPDPLQPARALPRVSLLQAWNEPNLARYLEPQWVASGGRWEPFSPVLYRQMLNAFYAAVKAVSPADRVIAAGLAPNGDRAGAGRMAPVTFLQSLLCLHSAPSTAGCPQTTDFDVLAIHPLSVGNPDLAAASSKDVSLSDLAKVRQLLDQAVRARTVGPAGPKPLWVTEINWESNPPSRSGVPARLQAHWLSRGLHRLWIAGVSAVIWQFLSDPVGLKLGTPTGGQIPESRPAGLYTAGSVAGPLRPKPFLSGFALPFDPLRYNGRLVRVWALLSRPRMAARLQVQRGRAWKTVATLAANRFAVVNALVALTGRAELRLVTRSATSAAWTIGAEPAALD